MTRVPTSTGRALNLADPDPEDIDFVFDVAPSLARLPRFCGHRRPSLLHPFFPEPGYSVAQHSVLGAEEFLARSRAAQGAQAMRLREAAFLFLLHDAHEAYLGDITRPVADALGVEARCALRVLKAGLDRAIMTAAGCDAFLRRAEARGRDLVAEMDLSMLRAERDALLLPTPIAWDSAVEQAAPVGVRIHPVWLPWEACQRWLALFHRLAPPQAARDALAPRPAAAPADLAAE